MKIGICTFSFTGACREAGITPDPLDAFQLIDIATENGMDGVEFPLGNLGEHPGEKLDECRSLLSERGLAVAIDSPALMGDEMETALSQASDVGAQSMRSVISGILEGDRSKPPGPDWDAYLATVIDRLKALVPAAEEAGVAIGIENHQDLTSADLVRISEEVESPFVGVTLDVGNALAVGEHPVSFAEAVAPFIKNVHLKDYYVYLTEQGYRLVRCPFGDGAVPFDEVLAAVLRESPEATLNIENGATSGRHIKLHENSFWQYYPAAQRERMAPALALAKEHARPADEEWRTPHELEKDAQERAKYERAQFEKSVENARAFQGV
ncbi:MAG: sugar phosphate isomerase/epimerase family protein [Planctomycetota bacterium]|jgi:sugar phosphate isomerase/epimerase|nr:sugar phosphate isomerase/epimerase family protein [Planctomycetota bacterium]MDP7252518.1 sugar phosphate isomerase/epimerase family protein [Planctomycetota bacterium]